jgi:hypothetical protein
MASFPFAELRRYGAGSVAHARYRINPDHIQQPGGMNTPRKQTSNLAQFPIFERHSNPSGKFIGRSEAHQHRTNIYKS